MSLVLLPTLPLSLLFLPLSLSPLSSSLSLLFLPLSLSSFFLSLSPLSPLPLTKVFFINCERILSHSVHEVPVNSFFFSSSFSHTLIINDAQICSWREEEKGKNGEKYKQQNNDKIQ